jgi:hypothetical protein
LDYGTVTDWTNLTDLITNRANVINQMLGARFDGSPENPLQVRHSKGTYKIYVCGEVLCAWTVYDLDKTKKAYESLESVNDAIWLLSRSGRLSFSM